MSDRKAWSSLAAEAEAMQAADQMNPPIRHITVYHGNNLYLRRVIQSGRPIINDQIALLQQSSTNTEDQHQNSPRMQSSRRKVTTMRGEGSGNVNE